MDIKKNLVSQDKLKEVPEDFFHLVFGRNFTDHMFIMKYTEEKGWHDPEIKPYENLCLDPAAIIFHYGQEVFEGQKAYRSPEGKILLFRPDENGKRMNASLERMCMPEIPLEDFITAEKELLKVEQRWVPSQRGCALYMRPNVIATEPGLGLRPSTEYLFYIILSPVGPYYKKGFNPVSLWVSTEYVRSVKGGTGAAKTGGNYAGSLLASKIAFQKGYDQVLWLDAKELKYVEEVGAMNIFFYINDTLVTPELSGSILPGITRKSIIDLAKDMGIKVEERRISIDEVIESIENGSLKESFGCGTAAVITPVGTIGYKDKNYIINDNKTGELTEKLFDILTGIQYGEIEDKFGWNLVIE